MRGGWQLAGWLLCLAVIVQIVSARHIHHKRRWNQRHRRTELSDGRTERASYGEAKPKAGTKAEPQAELEEELKAGLKADKKELKDQLKADNEELEDQLKAEPKEEPKEDLEGQGRSATLLHRIGESCSENQECVSDLCSSKSFRCACPWGMKPIMDMMMCRLANEVGDHCETGSTCTTGFCIKSKCAVMSRGKLSKISLILTFIGGVLLSAIVFLIIFKFCCRCKTCGHM